MNVPPGLERDLAAVELADADLRSLQVGHDRRPRGRACCADVAHQRRALDVIGAVPCEKLRRTTSTPAAIMRSSTSGALDAGPRVATILVARARAESLIWRPHRPAMDVYVIPPAPGIGRRRPPPFAGRSRRLPARPAHAAGARLEDLDRGQRLALEKFEESAAAGRDVARCGRRRRTWRSPRGCRRRRRSRTPATAAIASATAFVPPPNASNSNTPTGPFQTMVPAFAMMVGSTAHRSAGRCRGSGRRRTTSSIAFSVGVAVGGELLGADDIDRNRHLRRAHSSSIACASATRSGSASDLPMLAVRREEEGVGDAAADDQRVDLRGERLQHRQLGRDLGAADDRDQRPLRDARAPCRARRARPPAAARRRRPARTWRCRGSSLRRGARCRRRRCT